MSERLTVDERRRAVWEVECAKCGALPGHACVRPKGGRGAHRERVASLRYLSAAEVRRLLANPVRRAPLAG